MGPEDLREHPYIDAVIKGEGEITFTELLKVYLGNGSIEETDGVSCRINGKILE